MASLAFALCSEAASVAGIQPSDIGVPATNFVTKAQLIATGKFDSASLSSYGDDDFVLLQDLAKGTARVDLAINSDVTSRGTVQIDNGTAGESASVEVSIGTEVVAKCNLLKEGDVFDGWYNGSQKVNSNPTYSFSPIGNVSLVAKILYLDVTPTELSFEVDGGEQELSVSSNVSSWSVS